MRQVIGTVALAASGVSAVALGAYNVDPSSVSASGISAGGFFSAQIGIAYSNVFKTGFGVFAGGPYDCARNQMYTSCMNNGKPDISKPTQNLQSWSGHQIDPVENLKSRKVYMQAGTADTTVGVGPMNQLKSQLGGFVDAANTVFVTTEGAAHVFPTDFDATGNNACGRTASPFISNCGYDGAGEVLKHMYGDLQPRNDGQLSGKIEKFDQIGDFGAVGMDTTGYLYVPAACADGANVCKLHVAVHGCLQSFKNIGTKYVENTGYNKWADTNNIIVLYPQAVPDFIPRMVWSGTLLPNPNACFDWVGWYGTNADQKGGVQLASVVNQVNKITSGFKG